MCTFKNLEEILKTWKIFEKTSGNPDKMKNYIFLYKIQFKIEILLNFHT